MPGNPSMKSIQEPIENFRNEHKITVDQIQKDLLEIKDTIIQNLLDENKRLKDRVKALEDQADEHDEQMVDIEKHSHSLVVGLLKVKKWHDTSNCDTSMKLCTNVNHHAKKIFFDRDTPKCHVIADVSTFCQQNFFSSNH